MYIAAKTVNLISGLLSVRTFFGIKRLVPQCFIRIMVSVIADVSAVLIALVSFDKLSVITTMYSFCPSSVLVGRPDCQWRLAGMVRSQ